MFVGFCGYVKKKVSCIITSFCWPIRNSRKTSCRISGPFRCRLPWIPSPAILDAAGDRCRIPEEREWNPGNRFQQQKWMLLGGFNLPLWKIWVRQWEGWHPIYIPYIMEKKHVPNHQPEWIWVSFAMINQNHVDFEGGVWPYIVTFAMQEF